MPTPTASPTRLRFAVAPQFGVDPTTGNLTALQLMAAGREAKGHGIYIDDKTLETAAAAVTERGGRLKAYVTHNHAGPGTSYWPQPDMDEPANELNIPGFFSAIAVKAEQLVAGQFEFYEAFKKNFAPQYEQLLEMAKKTPDLLGLSVECWGYLAYVAKDGTEYSAEPDDVELLYNGMPALRVTDLWAAAFVSDGAATDGLFARLSRVFGGKQNRAQRAALAAALTQFATEYAAEPGEGPLPAPIEDTPPNPDPSFTVTMKIIAALKAKITDAKRFAAAMSIVGNTPEAQLAALTVEAVEAQLAATDLSTAQAEVTRLTAELATRDTTITTLTAERNDWKQKFETLKASGKPGSVDLGAPTGGVTADEPNPWIRGASFNRTRQAELLKADPTRAAALKAAAGTVNAAVK